MTEYEKQKLGRTLWAIADQLRGAMNADDFRDYMLAFLFLRYLSDNYEAAAQKELGADYPKLAEGERRAPLADWYENNAADTAEFEKQMRRKVHYVVRPEYLWTSIAEQARTQDKELLHTLQNGFAYIENESFAKYLSGPVLGDQPGFGQARQDLPRAQCPVVQDHRRDRQGPDAVFHQQRHPGAMPMNI